MEVPDDRQPLARVGRGVDAAHARHRRERDARCSCTQDRMCLPWSVVLVSAAVGRLHLQVRACEIAREDALFAAVRMLLDTAASRILTNTYCGHPPEW